MMMVTKTLTMVQRRRLCSTLVVVVVVVLLLVASSCTFCLGAVTVTSLTMEEANENARAQAAVAAAAVRSLASSSSFDDLATSIPERKLPRKLNNEDKESASSKRKRRAATTRNNNNNINRDYYSYNYHHRHRQVLAKLDTNIPDAATPKCFADAEAAAVMGTLILEALWQELLTTTVQHFAKKQAWCKPYVLRQVYRAYFRPDVLVQDRWGNIVSQTLDELIDQDIGTYREPGPVLETCRRRHLQYDTTETIGMRFQATSTEAVTHPGVYNDFVWIGNAIAVGGGEPPVEIAHPRQYMMEFIGQAGGFLYEGGDTGREDADVDADSSTSTTMSGQTTAIEQQNYDYYQSRGVGGSGRKTRKSQGKKSKSGYSNNNAAATSTNYSEHCHRPQIYGIVLMDYLVN